MKNLIVTIIFFISRLDAFGIQPVTQEKWKYVTGKNDIKVYTRVEPDSRIKSLKAECVLDATMEEIRSLLLDVPGTVKWMCHAKRCELMRRVSANELYYYTEVSLPWPLDNRDFVTHFKWTEDPVTGTVTVNSPAVPDMLPAKPGKVRINHSRSIWRMQQTDAGKIKVEYELLVDPGGMIPAHVVNAFAVRAPVETFTNMKKELKARRHKPVNPTR